MDKLGFRERNAPHRRVELGDMHIRGTYICTNVEAFSAART